MPISQCPFCEESIQAAANICPHCRRSLQPLESLDIDEPGRPHSLTGLTYRPDWVGANLSGADLQEATMGGANLRGASLTGANMGEINLSQADLTRADLSGANLSEADLSEAVLHRAQLKGANLVRANLFKADLTGTVASGTDLSRANLSGSDWTGADLSRANMSQTDLVQANFSRANLSGAIVSDIRDWSLIESVRGANLYGLREAPSGFLEWAQEHGALSVAPEEPIGDQRGRNSEEAEAPAAEVTGEEIT